MPISPSISRGAQECKTDAQVHTGIWEVGARQTRVLRPHKALSLVQSPQPMTSAMCVGLIMSHGMPLPPQGRAHCPPAPPWEGPAQLLTYLMPRRVLTHSPHWEPVCFLKAQSSPGCVSLELAMSVWVSVPFTEPRVGVRKPGPDTGTSAAQDHTVSLKTAPTCPEALRPHCSGSPALQLAISGWGGHNVHVSIAGSGSSHSTESRPPSSWGTGWQTQTRSVCARGHHTQWAGVGVSATMSVVGGREVGDPGLNP